MDFGALPPEINSARMYSGPGSGSMLAGAAAWDGLAEELHSAAASSGSVVSGLTGGPWSGPASASMAAAAAPYVAWMSSTAAQAEQTAAQARAAAAAYEAAFAMTVPPPVIAANRSLLMSLVATNFLGQNTPAIAATEAHYAEMWAQDAAAMYGYAGNSAAASTLTPFTTPPQTTNPVAAAAQTAGAAASTDTQAALSQLTAAVPQALQSLASPATSSGSEAGTSSLLGLTSLMMPLRMATMPLMMLSRLAMMGSMGSMGAAGAKTASAGANVLGSAAAAGAGAGLVGSAGLGDLVASAGPVVSPVSTVSAGLGQAMPVGALSVPQSWAAATPTLVSSATATPVTAISTAPAAGPSIDLSGLPPMMPVANMAGRGVSETAPQLDIRPTVMARSPLGG